MPRGGGAKTGKRAQQRVVRMAEAFELRAAGLSHRQIAEKLGVSVRTAFQLVEQGFREHPAENIEVLRGIELEKLDASERREFDLIGAHHPIALAAVGKESIDSAGVVHDAEQSLSRIRAHRARILGIEAPKRTEVTGANGGPLEIADLSKLTDEQLAQLAAGVAIDAGQGSTRASTPREAEDREAAGLRTED